MSRLLEIEQKLFDKQITIGDVCWLIARAKRLEKTLEFYADDNNFLPIEESMESIDGDYDLYETTNIVEDGGLKAKEALEDEEV